ncbi:MAG TPA: CoF synthetase, partial [Rhodospirillum rubrum]|nr:CoF synthetase [Rhodospirillum rubrum]
IRDRSDIFGACAGMCEERQGLHWAEDHILVEVLDPLTGEPVAEGERGELVLTTLRKRARPLIRFRVGDIVSFTSEPCACGRTSKRLLGVHGRVDDMLIIRGVNIFPSDIEAIVRKDHDFTGEYRLVVERVDHLDALSVEVEHRAGLNTPPEALAARLRGQIKAVTGVGARVVVLAPDSLPRATHKAKRIDDRRTGVWTA